LGISFQKFSVVSDEYVKSHPNYLGFFEPVADTVILETCGKLFLQVKALFLHF
jgi:hypothetical protein